MIGAGNSFLATASCTQLGDMRTSAQTSWMSPSATSACASGIGGRWVVRSLRSAVEVGSLFEIDVFIAGHVSSCQGVDSTSEILEVNSTRDMREEKFLRP